MSDIAQLNVRLLNADIEIVRQMAKKRHVSQAVVVAEAIRLLGNAQDVWRYEACTRLGMTKNADRQQFTLWCIENEVPPSATLDEWQSYLESFETSGDAADLAATQKDALGVLT